MKQEKKKEQTNYQISMTGPQDKLFDMKKEHRAGDYIKMSKT